MANNYSTSSDFIDSLKKALQDTRFNLLESLVSQPDNAHFLSGKVRGIEEAETILIEKIRDYIKD